MLGILSGIFGIFAGTFQFPFYYLFLFLFVIQVLVCFFAKKRSTKLLVTLGFPIFELLLFLDGYFGVIHYDHEYVSNGWTTLQGLDELAYFALFFGLIATLLGAAAGWLIYGLVRLAVKIHKRRKEKKKELAATA